MDAKINDNSYFSEKGQNTRNYSFYNRKRGSRCLISHEKINSKSMQNRCKKKACNSMENDTKYIQNGSQNPSKISTIPEKAVSEN